MKADPLKSRARRIVRDDSQHVFSQELGAARLRVFVARPPARKARELRTPRTRRATPLLLAEHEEVMFVKERF